MPMTPDTQLLKLCDQIVNEPLLYGDAVTVAIELRRHILSALSPVPAEDVARAKALLDAHSIPEPADLLAAPDRLGASPVALPESQDKEAILALCAWNNVAGDNTVMRAEWERVTKDAPATREAWLRVAKAIAAPQVAPGAAQCSYSGCPIAMRGMKDGVAASPQASPAPTPECQFCGHEKMKCGSLTMAKDCFGIEYWEAQQAKKAAPTQMMAEREALAKWFRDYGRFYSGVTKAATLRAMSENDADALLSSGTVVKVPTKEALAGFIAATLDRYVNADSDGTPTMKDEYLADAILSLLRGR